MTVYKLIKKFSDYANIAFYENRKLVAQSDTRELFANYPFDMDSYFLLNRKVKSYRIDIIANEILFKINIKSEE